MKNNGHTSSFLTYPPTPLTSSKLLFQDETSVSVLRVYTVQSEHDKNPVIAVTVLAQSFWAAR